jgi:hypothetical protein
LNFSLNYFTRIGQAKPSQSWRLALSQITFNIAGKFIKGMYGIIRLKFDMDEFIRDKGQAVNVVNDKQNYRLFTILEMPPIAPHEIGFGGGFRQHNHQQPALQTRLLGSDFPIAASFHEVLIDPSADFVIVEPIN